jgi:1-acyl-sn-glycerol-3-phosphate acyltransferase
MRSAPVRTVLSVWAWLVLGVACIVIVPMVAVVRLVTMPFDPGAYRAGRLFRMIGVVHEKLNPMWKFTVTGNAPDDPRRPYVVVANHESFVDILLICHVPMEMKWMSKSDFFRYPFVGWGMRLVRDIRLDRDDAKGGARALQDCRERLDQHVSVMIFPEGTRSKSGELQPFKDGAFRLAIDSGLPILPLAVLGTRDALVKHDWRFGFSRAEVRILDPIPTDGFGKADVAELRDRTRDRVAAALDEMRSARHTDAAERA